MVRISTCDEYADKKPIVFIRTVVNKLLEAEPNIKWHSNNISDIGVRMGRYSILITLNTISIVGEAKIVYWYTYNKYNQVWIGRVASDKTHEYIGFDLDDKFHHLLIDWANDKVNV